MVLAVERHDDAGVFAALGLVDRGGVGELQLVEIFRGVVDLPALEADGHLRSLLVDRGDAAEIAVPYFQVVIVADLHHLVAHPEAPPAMLDRRAAGIQPGAQPRVQALDADRPAVHRRQDLNLGDRIETEARGDPLGDQLLDRPGDLLGIAPLDEEEIAPRGGGGRDLAAVDPVGVDHDRALAGLAEDLGQAYHVHHAGTDQIAEHAPRTDRGELVDVAHQNQAAARRDRLREARGELGVDHRGLVDDRDLGVERQLGTALEAAQAGIELEQAVERRGLDAGRLGEPFGRPAGGRGERHFDPFLGQDADEAANQRGLARARAAGDHQELAQEAPADRLPLLVGELDPLFLAQPAEGPVRIDLEGTGRRRAEDEAPEPLGERRFGGVEGGEIDRGFARPRRGKGRLSGSAPLHHGLAGGGDRLERPVERLGLDASEQGRGLGEQPLPREVEMSPLAPLGERVEQPGLKPAWGVGSEAERRGDPIGALEPDAEHLGGEPERVLAHHRERVRAEAPVDPVGVAGRDAVRLEEDHQLAHALLLVPGAPDVGAPFRADPGHLGQAVRRALDHLERLQAEASDDPFRHFNPDAADHPRGEIALDTDEGGRGDGLERQGAELAAELRVVEELALEPKRFARLDSGERSDHGGRLSPSRGGQAQHRPTGLGVLEDDPLDRSLEALDRVAGRRRAEREGHRGVRVYDRGRVGPDARRSGTISGADGSKLALRPRAVPGSGPGRTR